MKKRPVNYVRRLVVKISNTSRMPEQWFKIGENRKRVELTGPAISET